jgi:opacity protein-like surface antigen
MRKISIFFLILSFCVFNLAIIGYASPKTQKENAQTETGEGQQEGNKGRKGDIEFSTAASLDIDKMKQKIDEEWEEEALTTTTFSVPLRVGYFITNNIEIEPEIIFNRVHMSYMDESASTTVALLLANVAFNFSTTSQVMPFVLGGVGLMTIGASYDGEDESESGFAWNAGAGIKWFATNRVALRIEYRFIHYSMTTEYDVTISHTNHRIFVGISMFF